MKSSSLYIALAFVCVGLWGTAQARDIVVPAGTLMTCTLDEPKFSSATVTVGDPFLCYPRALQQFGQVVFPRGTYIVGHLEADKDPGHFWGKGYLKLAFDRIGLPSADLPVTAKIIAVSGYNVDRQGKIIGHGHAKRDAVEWMLPPLWPWKVLTLPARGPRPTLKTETRITLRVMDDIIIPQPNTTGWHRFGESPSSFSGSNYQDPPRTVVAAAYPPNPPSIAVVPEIEPLGTVAARLAAARTRSTVNATTIPGCQPESTTFVQSATLAPAMAEPVAIETTVVQPAIVPPRVAVSSVKVIPRPGPRLAAAWDASVTLFVLVDGTVFPATNYWRDHDQLWYFSGDSDKGTVSLSSIDWTTTTKLNVARNVRVNLRNAPVDSGAN